MDKYAKNTKHNRNIKYTRCVLLEYMFIYVNNYFETNYQ